jgi:uncharacterized protein
MAMTWHDLLFMHWPVPAAAVRPLIPSSLEIDTFPDSTGAPSAWLGIVPFTMTGVRARCTPAVPGPGAFHELNVRTYVRLGGVQRDPALSYPGVWFFSLDAASPTAVLAARTLFHLPYFRADMTVARDGPAIRYSSMRSHRRAAPAAYQAAYQPTGPAYRSKPGSLDHWLTERYCLYSVTHGGRVLRCDIQHAPWPLQPAAADVRQNSMGAQIGLEPPAIGPILHFAKRLDVVAWLPSRLSNLPE